jgi:hypothetical protein
VIPGAGKKVSSAWYFISFFFTRRQPKPRDQLTLSVASTSRLKFWPFRVFTVIFILASFKRCINGAALIVQRSSKRLPEFLTVLFFCSSGFFSAAKVCKVAAHQSRFRGLLKTQRQKSCPETTPVIYSTHFSSLVSPGKKRGCEPNDHIQMLPKSANGEIFAFRAAHLKKWTQVNALTSTVAGKGATQQAERCLVEPLELPEDGGPGLRFW